MAFKLRLRRSDGRAFPPQPVGQAEPEAVMGKGSGIDNCKHWLAKFQIEAPEEQAMEGTVVKMGLEHKRLMHRGRVLNLAKDVLSN